MTVQRQQLRNLWSDQLLESRLSAWTLFVGLDLETHVRESSHQSIDILRISVPSPISKGIYFFDQTGAAAGHRQEQLCKTVALSLNVRQ